MIVETRSSCGSSRGTVAGSPLPSAVLEALASIVGDMRDVPRDCIVDRAELILWLRRMAARVDGVSRMRVPAPIARSPRVRAMTARERADAVFKPAGSTTPKPSAVNGLGSGNASVSTTPIRLRPRTIVMRKGRQVRVEVRNQLRWEF